MIKIKIAVVMGGMSSEHDVSLMSGREIIKNLNKKKYSVTPIIIKKGGNGIEEIINKRPDVVFIALHGKYGEDGVIQGFLDSLKIKYTGSGVLASAIGMDKIIFRKLMQSESLPVPKFTLIDKKDFKIPKDLKPPYFVKPHNGGSSVGVSFVKNSRGLRKAIKLSFKYSNKVLVEEYIKGVEVSCAVLGNEKPLALPVIEIRPLKNDFFDYKSKYSYKGSEEVAPARISKKLTEEIQKLSIKVYKIVGCRGYARLDFILEEGVKPIILEINTLPGMTPNSLLPKEAAALGITYSELLDRIISLAIVK